MIDRNPDDVTAISQLVEDNVRLTAEIQVAITANGGLQLRIIELERRLALAPKDNMRQFERQRDVALTNGKNGHFPS